MVIKVIKRATSSTFIQTWQTYYFQIDGKRTVLVEKQGGVFKFWSKHCKNIQEAKRHIEDCILIGKTI